MRPANTLLLLGASVSGFALRRRAAVAGAAGGLAAVGLSRTTPPRAMVIDSHLHVWSSTFPYAPGKEPPPELGDAVASAEALDASLKAVGADGALVVQPINYEFDHSYVASVLSTHKNFRGMALANPADPGALAALVDGAPPGTWTGVRFNPYLWPEAARTGAWLADGAGLALLEICHARGLAIGVMAFQGLTPLLPSIEALLAHPKAVPVVIDHWGFPRESPGAPAAPGLAFDEAAWEALLKLGRDHATVYVKLSALFRVSREGPPYADLKPRFAALVDAYGADRLMWGSDFPFAQLSGGQGASLDAVAGFCADLPAGQRAAILGGTARALFKFA